MHLMAGEAKRMFYGCTAARVMQKGHESLWAIIILNKAMYVQSIDVTEKDINALLKVFTTVYLFFFASKQVKSK